MNIQKSIIIVLATLVFITKVFAGGLTARINTNTVTEGDTFQLILSSDDSDVESPDLAPLQSDFEVLGTSTSTSVQYINGHKTNSSEWVVTLSPKHKGEITIPSIKAGKVSSNALSIHAVDASLAPKQQGASDGISITTRINGESEKFYVFQEIPITIRIETSRPILSAKIFPPKIKAAELTQTSRDRQSQLTTNGRNINVIERDYILRTEKAGEIKLNPFVFKGQVPEPRQQRRDPFAEFDSLFGGRSPFAGQQRGKPFIVRSNSLNLNIKGNSNTNGNEWFLPAKSVELQSKWQPNFPTFKQGEAVTRIVTLVATGARAEQLPKLAFESIDGAKIYVDDDKTAMLRDTGNGSKALREITLSVVPTQSGEVTLPEVQVKWLNTETNQTEVATLSSEIIQVIGNGAATENEKENTNPSKSVEKTEKSTEINDSDTEVTTLSSLIKRYSNIQLFAALLMTLFSVLSIALWKIRKSKSKSRDPQEIHDEAAQIKDLRLQLNNALKTRDEKALYQSLINWAIQDTSLKENTQMESLFQQLEDRLYCSKTSLMAIDFQKAAKTINHQWARVSDKKVKTKTLPELYILNK